MASGLVMRNVNKGRIQLLMQLDDLGAHLGAQRHQIGQRLIEQGIPPGRAPSHVRGATRLPLAAGKLLGLCG